jgi:hypothetical protein
MGDGLQAGRTKAVHRFRRNGLRQAGAQSNHSPHVHSLFAFRESASQDYVINLGRV